MDIEDREGRRRVDSARRPGEGGGQAGRRRILITGGGQTGGLIAGRLVREGHEVTIVEQVRERCAELENALDVKVVRGSATSVRVLRAAGMREADMLIAVTDSDEANVLACLAAQADSDIQVKAARLRTHEVDQWREVLERVGLRIDLVIHPETDVLERIMRTLHAPGVSDIVDFADGRVKLFGMNVKRDSWFANRTVTHLAEAGPPDNCMTALIFRGQQVIIPHGAELLLPGDHIYIVTTAVNLDAAMRFMGIEAQRVVKRVLIVGGRQIGILAAEALERENVRVKLMELDAARCEKIAGIVRKTVVIHGDGTDQSTLEEENVEGVDAFLALTSHDEDNIMASLLARRMGARKVVALINRLNYLPMVQRLGINATVSPRLTTVDRVLQFVRQGAVLSVTTFREEEAEAIELLAEAGSRYVGKPLKDIRFPREAIVGAIARSDGSVVVPRGNAQIEVGDRVIFFARESVVPKLESAFLAHAKRGYWRDPVPRNRLRSRTVPRDFRGNDDDPSGVGHMGW